MFRIELKKQVDKFLNQLDVKEHRQCIEALNELKIDPFRKRPKCDIKKLSGKKNVYRLRVRDLRFNYDVKLRENLIIVEEAFRRGRGYR